MLTVAREVFSTADAALAFVNNINPADIISICETAYVDDLGYLTEEIVVWYKHYRQDY